MGKQLIVAAIGDVAFVRPPSADLHFGDAWTAADLRIANLEAPLTEGGIPAAKLIRLRSPSAAASWLADLKCDAVSLANNHIMDWGVPGLRATLRALDSAGVRRAGAGCDAAEAETPAVLEPDGWRVAFLSWACTVPPGFDARGGRGGLAAIRVRTSYAADPMLIDEQPGTPPWVHTEPVAEDVQRLRTVIAQAREKADVVILALHWGVPPQWQSPFQGPLAEYQVPLGRAAIDAGADLILGHHAHTVYGLEAVERSGGHGTGLICYSLGNYAFHPLGDRAALELDSPLRPYHAPERPENSETYLASFTFCRDASGVAGVVEACLEPAHLAENGEARKAEPEQARRIADRVARFSTSRGTRLDTEADGSLRWRL